ncbi:outer membrane surface antigen protein [Nonlabens sp. MIC269]|uniref:POTRA domain-containing protein n=1 Tax=Nonlabens sp. MIC269 TaxID=1476901 RepID=UPI000720C871|nr:POTRA domain-containing protein [Nonlabens sp. MIC269]ALM19930.1 outer membrane surface antigen protein [Nonlabens sp. MIC269]
MKKAVALIIYLVITSSFAQNDMIIERIEFEGLKKTKESFLRYLIKTKEGNVVNFKTLNSDLERLNRLAGIAKATYQLTNDENRTTIAFSIVENFTIIPGVRVSQASDDSFSYRLSLFEFNLLGRNQIVGGFYAKNVFNSFGLYWEAPYAISNKWGIGVNYISNITREPIYQNNEEQIYKFNNPNASLYVLYEHNFHNNFQLGVKYSDERYERIEDLTILNLPEHIEEKRYSILSEYENNHINIDYQYIKGSRNQINLEYKTGMIDELSNTLLVRWDSERFYRIAKKGNLANRIRLAYSSFNGSEFAPFTIDNQLNLRGSGNTVDRHTGAITINTEYRHTLFEKGWFVLQSNTFVDASAVRKPLATIENAFSTDGLNVYSGIGFRFIHKRIFNAVIRIDYGVRIAGDYNSSGITFGIGQYF